jgi:four helix bundle protein
MNGARHTAHGTRQGDEGRHTAKNANTNGVRRAEKISAAHFSFFRAPCALSRAPFFNPMGHFEKLKVWQRAKALAIYVYRLTAQGHFIKDFGLRDQMRRATISVASNIAEGDDYGSDKQAIRFFRMAKGSPAELLTQVIIAHEIGYVKDDEFNFTQEECKGISAMLAKLITARSE